MLPGSTIAEGLAKLRPLYTCCKSRCLYRVASEHSSTQLNSAQLSSTHSSTHSSTPSSIYCRYADRVSPIYKASRHTAPLSSTHNQIDCRYADSGGSRGIHCRSGGEGNSRGCGQRANANLGYKVKASYASTPPFIWFGLVSCTWATTPPPRSPAHPACTHKVLKTLQAEALPRPPYTTPCTSHSI